MASKTKVEEGELVVNQIIHETIGNAIEMSRKKTTSFIDKYSRSMTNIVENEEHERVSLPLALLNIENENSTNKC